MQKCLLRIFVLILLSTPMYSLAQNKKGQDPKKAAKEQLQKREQNERDGEKALAKARDKHFRSQSKNSRKSMKRNKKRSKKHREGKDSIFRRIFN